MGGEQIKLSRENAQLFAEKNHGLRIPIMNRIGVPRGWIINGKLDSEIWGKIKACAIPLPKKGILSGISRTAREARLELREIQEKYGQDAFFLMLPDFETEHSWSARPVLPIDLDKDIETLMNEGWASEGQEQDFFLLDIKRHALMATTGWSDTK